MSVTAYPKRLIEVDLPIKEISKHARREKSIRHGRISTLHILRMVAFACLPSRDMYRLLANLKHCNMDSWRG
jgi:hypothetical protein